MQRRHALAALSGLAMAGPWASRSAGAADGRVVDARSRPPVRWADVKLIDGSLLPAAALDGRTVVVEFWASWCPFCMKQNPLIEKLHRGSDPATLRVLTFTIDKTEKAARDYMAKHGYTFAAAMAGAQSEAWFGPRHGLPVVHVVDPQGRVVFSESGEMFEEDVAALSRYAARR